MPASMTGTEPISQVTSSIGAAARWMGTGLDRGKDWASLVFSCWLSYRDGYVEDKAGIKPTTSRITRGRELEVSNLALSNGGMLVSNSVERNV